MSGPPNGQPPVTYPAQAPSNVPFIPPWNPYIMPPGVFDALIAASGVRLLWQKSHLCACTYGGPIPGSPDPACSTCSGRGYYWDSPVGPFVGLITFIHLVTSPDEPGAIMDEKFGQIFRGKPTLTIPYAGAPTVWSQSSTNDIFVEMDALDRFQRRASSRAKSNRPVSTSALDRGLRRGHGLRSNRTCDELRLGIRRVRRNRHPPKRIRDRHAIRRGADRREGLRRMA